MRHCSFPVNFSERTAATSVHKNVAHQAGTLIDMAPAENWSHTDEISVVKGAMLAIQFTRAKKVGDQTGLGRQDVVPN